MSHAHVSAGRGFWDGKLAIDGEDFPYPIRSIAYRLDTDTSPPMLTVEFEVDRLTIDHDWAKAGPLYADSDAEAEAEESA